MSALQSRCECGQVQLQTVGKPILSGVCYCDDCQAGSRKVQSLPAASQVMDEDGGTQYLTYRDDRIKCVAGEHLLVGYKLKDKSPTTRFVASCCNTAMFLKFKPGHWVSAYRRRFVGERPPLEMRTQTKFRESDLPIPTDCRSYKRWPAKLFAKLIGARVAMWLGR